MCHIFAGQDPAAYAYQTRSVRLNGYSTSLRLEERFWRLVDEIPARPGPSPPKLLSHPPDGGTALGRDTENVTSVVRCACVVYLEQKQGDPAQPGPDEASRAA